MKSYQKLGIVPILLLLVEGCGPNAGPVQPSANAAHQVAKAGLNTNTALNTNASNAASIGTSNTTSNVPGSNTNDANSSTTGGTGSTDSTTGNSGAGWKFVNLESVFGQDVTIDGLSSANGQLKVFIRHDVADNSGGITFSKTGYVGMYSPAKNQVTKTGTITKTQSEVDRTSPAYQGPVQLVFPTTFPTKFQTQSVKIEKNGVPLAAWPAAIPLYGSAANPQSAAPGDLDNVIIGQEGDDIWVASKGPQYPPLYPHQSPMLWGFRHWNRLVAFNVKTGAAVLYTIPPTYSLYQNEVSSTISLVNPSFLYTGKNVWVGLGDWIGEFPANPGGNLSAGKVQQANSPVLVAPPASYVHEQETAMMNDLKRREQQAATSLASYWNHVVGKTVAGVPAYKDFQDGKRQAWNLDPVIFNHGVLPSDITWAMEFPLKSGDPLTKERQSVEQAIVDMLNCPLNFDAIGIVPKSSSDVRAQFGGHPPITLPGYQIRNDAYWPIG